jgi:hypothetical protein
MEIQKFSLKKYIKQTTRTSVQLTVSWRTKIEVGKCLRNGNALSSLKIGTLLLRLASPYSDAYNSIAGVPNAQKKIFKKINAHLFLTIVQHLAKWKEHTDYDNII